MHYNEQDDLDEDTQTAINPEADTDPAPPPSVRVSPPGVCEKTGEELRFEYTEKLGLAGFCLKCLTFHVLCKNQKHMMYCQKPPGHDGPHAYQVSPNVVEEW